MVFWIIDILFSPSNGSIRCRGYFPNRDLFPNGEAFHLHLSARFFALKSIKNGKPVLYQAPASWQRLTRLLCHFYVFGRPLEFRRHCGNLFLRCLSSLMILCKIKDLLFFDYPRCKHTRYFAEKLTLCVTVNPQIKSFFINPGASPEEFFRLNLVESQSMYPYHQYWPHMQ